MVKNIYGYLRLFIKVETKEYPEKPCILKYESDFTKEITKEALEVILNAAKELTEAKGFTPLEVSFVSKEVYEKYAVSDQYNRDSYVFGEEEMI